eukprot:3621503-Pleurochrysis_carterae.AAC.1
MRAPRARRADSAPAAWDTRFAQRRSRWRTQPLAQPGAVKGAGVAALTAAAAAAVSAAAAGSCWSRWTAVAAAAPCAR